MNLLNTLALSLLLLVSPGFAFELGEPVPLKKSRLIIIMDDLGDNYRLGRRIINLPVPLNIAFLPNTPFARKLANMANERGHDVMLHLPMEATTRHDLLGQDALKSSHSYQEAMTIFEENLASVPHVRGFNNHMGSHLTKQSEPMKWLMEEARQRDLYFVDSRTVAGSVAFSIALHNGVPAIARDVFLDPVSAKKSTIRAQLKKAMNIAQNKGVAVIIGHPYPETLEVLEQELPNVLRHFDVVKLSDFFGG
ncbi:divergent polysaccharide deacetylase family protein [Pleionea sp. CnH1-48]|uniref:divergent polysaccharide deacetylase family protein n=1 Tax=Pleionea sp. CnH1-48 TaxID=2954494 RepID=UPI002097FF75|nr:divergent polysaccharide deacetylase family protein [Pleionea sp. CnH1-48]MCO7225176.1 divergent polysaccharide deacetylase family protein [Pleionea sp. CnH1-48]